MWRRILLIIAAGTAIKDVGLSSLLLGVQAANYEKKSFQKRKVRVATSRGRARGNIKFNLKAKGKVRNKGKIRAGVKVKNRTKTRGRKKLVIERKMRRGKGVKVKCNSSIQSKAKTSTTRLRMKKTSSRATSPPKKPWMAPSIHFSTPSPTGLFCNVAERQSSISAHLSGKNKDNFVQRQASRWLLDSTTKCLPDEKLAQRLSLAVFYLSDNGNFWLNRTHWMSEKDECEWYGVICNESDLITELSLNENNVTGTIPIELMKGLPSIQSIGLFDNKLVGTVPHTIGYLTNLEFLDIEGNFLTGYIDEMLSNMSNIQTLTSLRVSFNALAGRIPPSISKFSRLEEFWAAGNNITGIIPDGMCKLTELTSLNLYKNNLGSDRFILESGRHLGLPSCIGRLQKLVQIDLSSNPLGGTIPDYLFNKNMSSLKRLHLSNMKLTGKIPPLGDLKQLNSLVLDRNNLNGLIPSDIGELTNLNVIQLNNNNLTGQIPDVHGLKDLNFFDLTHNNLHGTIPPHLIELSGLEYLYLGHNEITGNLPDLCQLSNATKIKDIFLNDNRITGTLPQCIPDGLTELLLNENMLSGSIAQSLCDYRGGGESNLKSLWLDCQHGVDGNIQNSCPMGCCTHCTVGKNL